LNKHLDLCVNIFLNTFFILENFLYDQAIIVWKKKKTCKAAEAKELGFDPSLMCCSCIMVHVILLQGLQLDIKHGIW
jgi:hypothetical protein